MSTDSAVVERLLAHNLWATRVILERCQTLSADQFTKRFEIGPGSLHDTLLHITGAMRRWIDRIQGGKIRPSVEEEPRTWTPPEILALLEETAAGLATVVRAVVREGRLEEPMTIRFRGLPEPVTFTRGSAIVHVLTHGVHHRAQALNMLRRLGVADIPEVDAITCELSATPL